MKPLTEIKKEIREELEKGIIRNKVLPLDWAMDRINPILEEQAQEFEKMIEELKKEEILFLDDLLLSYNSRFFREKIRKRRQELLKEVQVGEGK